MIPLSKEKQSRTEAGKPIPLYKLTKLEKSLEVIIGRAIIDENFAKVLFEDPDKIAAKFELDDLGREALKQFPKEEVKKFAESFKGRLLKDSALIIFCG